MEDREIVALYWNRSEDAILQTQIKYGSYCRSIACRILRSEEDADECVNDTYRQAWNAMPPHRPAILSTFLGKITRNLSINRLMEKSRITRGGMQVELTLSELGDCIIGSHTPERELEAEYLAHLISGYLRTLPKESRLIFLARYWHFLSIKEIADDFSVSRSKVKTLLYRTRQGLKRVLEKEGYMS